jgi:repressor LexA
MTYLTERQRDVLGYIRDTILRDGVAPTLQEIADAFAFQSTASAQKHVALLEKKGYLRREKHQKRGLVLAARDDGARPPGTRLPLLGVVAAGMPIESLPQAESITVPADLLRSGEHFVLRVRGDSMVEDGIHDGDFVIVHRAAEAADGEVVVALVGDEVTLKRIFRRPGGTVRLQPANAAMAPIDVAADQLRVQGVVVGLLRRY